MNARIRTHVWFAATAATVGASGWSLHEHSGPGVVLFLAAGMLFASKAHETHLAGKTAGQSQPSKCSELPASLRELAGFVDISAAAVLAEGHAAGVDAADRALDRVGDATSALVEKATERRVLELAFERNTAGREA